jgi:hypothetical protein
VDGHGLAQLVTRIAVYVVKRCHDPRFRPANEFAGYGSQVALWRLPTQPRQAAGKRWGGEPAQAGVWPWVARGFNRGADGGERHFLCIVPNTVEAEHT